MMVSNVTCMQLCNPNIGICETCLLPNCPVLNNSEINDSSDFEDLTNETSNPSNNEEPFSWGENYTSPFSIGDRIYARGFLNSCNNSLELGGRECAGIDAGQRGVIVYGPQSFAAPLWYKVEWDNGQTGWEVVGGDYKDLRSLPSNGFNIIGHAGMQGSGQAINGPARDIFRDSFYHWWKVEWDDGSIGWVRDYDLAIYDEETFAEASGNKTIEARIVSSGTNLAVRATPSTNGVWLGSKNSGSFGEVINGSAEANGYIWWKVRWEDNLEGWSIGNYLGTDLFKVGEGITLADGVNNLNVSLEPSSDSEIMATRKRTDPPGTPLKFNDITTGAYVSKINGYVRYFNEGKWWRRINWRQMITYKEQKNVLLIGWVPEDFIAVANESLKIGMEVHSSGYNLAVRNIPNGEWLESAYGVGEIVGGPSGTGENIWWQVRWGISGTTGWSLGMWLEPDYYWTLG